MTAGDNQIDYIKIKPDFSFIEVKFMNPIQIDEDTYNDRFGFESHLRPHKDFINALKKLRKLALEMVAIDVTKDFTEYSIVHIKVHGSIALKQSRVKMKLHRPINKYKHKYEIPTPSLKMFPSEQEKAASYERTEELVKLLHAFFAEVYEYVRGKYDDSMGIQLPLWK